MLLSTHKYCFEMVSSDSDQWECYVQTHPIGSIFHTRAMIRAFTASRGVEPWAWAARDQSGNIVALLVSCHVKTLRDFSSLSSRAVHYAEPLCDPTPKGIAALQKLIHLHDEHMRRAGAAV